MISFSLCRSELNLYCSLAHGSTEASERNGKHFITSRERAEQWDKCGGIVLVFTEEDGPTRTPPILDTANTASKVRTTSSKRIKDRLHSVRHHQLQGSEKLCDGNPAHPVQKLFPL